ncbi:hypothetical protein D3C74_48920 [compost metagenome]
MSDGMTDLYRANRDAADALEAEHKKLKAEYRSKVEEVLAESFPYHVSADYVKYAIDFYMTLPFVDYNQPVREDNVLVTALLPYILHLQYKKEGAYGRSWCKRGEMDTFFNTARKFDRIENMMLNGAKDEVGEGKVDTVGDMASYGLLWMTLLARIEPDDFISWFNNVK